MTVTRRPDAPATQQAPGLREVFETHGSFVCRSLRHLGVAEADLDDMLQEVFLVVYERLDNYEERGRARAWLYSICTRVARAQRRKITRRREGQSALLDDLPIAATQHGQLEDREALALGQRLLEQLPAPLREVFWLYEVEDMSMSEVASALDCPLQTAYSRLHTARRRILEAVAQADRAVGGHD